LYPSRRRCLHTFFFPPLCHSARPFSCFLRLMVLFFLLLISVRGPPLFPTLPFRIFLISIFVTSFFPLSILTPFKSFMMHPGCVFSAPSVLRQHFPLASPSSLPHKDLPTVPRVVILLPPLCLLTYVSRPWGFSSSLIALLPLQFFSFISLDTCHPIPPSALFPMIARAWKASPESIRMFCCWLLSFPAYLVYPTSPVDLNIG